MATWSRGGRQKIRREDEKARRAAEALGGAATRAAFSDLTKRMAHVESTLQLHTWMLGVIALAAMGSFIQGLFP